MVDATGAPQTRTNAVVGRARIQPAPGPSASKLPADDQLDRLLGDAELLYRLQLNGYAEDEWQRAAEEFARYGFDVMVGWLMTGRIWIEVHNKTGRHPKRPNEPFDEDTIVTLASDIVVAALDAFLEKVLKANRWDPSRGASLKTYFIGQCCFQFSNVLRSHYREIKRNREDPHEDPAAKVGSYPGPDHVLLENERYLELLDVVSSASARKAFALQDEGYTEDEIAQIIGVADAKTVENMLGYQRRKAKQQRLTVEAG